MSQNLAVLSRLKKGPLTPLQALHEIGTLRLAARIADLRCQGHAINTEMVEVRGKRIAKYSLIRQRKRSESKIRGMKEPLDTGAKG